MVLFFCLDCVMGSAPSTSSLIAAEEVDFQFKLFGTMVVVCFFMLRLPCAFVFLLALGVRVTWLEQACSSLAILSFIATEER